MILFLSESDVAAALPMGEAVGILEAAFAEAARGGGKTMPRLSEALGGTAGTFRMLSAMLPEQGVFGLKTLTGTPGKRLAGEVYFAVLLFDTASGALRAVISANQLTGLRTGAASGVAARYLAREEASSVGVIGAGAQAWFQVEAMCAVRPVKTVAVYARDGARAEGFAREVEEKLGVTATVAGSAREAVRGAAMVVTATTSSEPVMEGAWMEPGMHVSAIGANARGKKELDVACFERGRVVADDRVQVLEETGDVRAAIASGRVGPEVVYAELGEVVAGKKPGREDREAITIFKSVGVALEDVAVGASLYRNAVRDGLGTRLDAFARSGG